MARAATSTGGVEANGVRSLVVEAVLEDIFADGGIGLPAVELLDRHGEDDGQGYMKAIGQRVLREAPPIAFQFFAWTSTDGPVMAATMRERWSLATPLISASLSLREKTGAPDSSVHFIITISA